MVILVEEAVAVEAEAASDSRREKSCLGVVLAKGKREPGQDLIGAAISVVLLCEGHSQTIQIAKALHREALLFEKAGLRYPRKPQIL